MSIVLSSIVGVSMNKIVLWIRVGVDDWTEKMAIIASNALTSFAHKLSVVFTNFFLLSHSMQILDFSGCMLIMKIVQSRLC